jgi:hypothetical protein
VTRTGRWKHSFLKAFAETGNVTVAAGVANIHRGTVYEAREKDKAFATAYDDALAQAADRLEAEARRRALHLLVLAALAEKAADPRALARPVHHTNAAGDVAGVLRYAPLAGDEAARRGAHRQGAAFYRMALRHTECLGSRARAVLLEKLAGESALSGQHKEALEANAQALRAPTRLYDFALRDNEIVAIAKNPGDLLPVRALVDPDSYPTAWSSVRRIKESFRILVQE